MAARVRHIAAAVLLAACCAGVGGSFAQAQAPPFGGTAYLSTNIITEANASAFTGMSYQGLGSRLVYDRRVNQFVRIPMHLFAATFADGLDAEVQVNPEFGDPLAAGVQADRYARAVGRLPTSLRLDVDSITIHDGYQPFGGGNRNILIHTVQAVAYGGYLEEVLFHEATHTSYDQDHAFAPGWVAAQQSDGKFISTYARDNPTREDVAESLLPWYALRYSTALFPFQIDAINATIPHRLEYFDALTFTTYNPPVPGDFNGDRRVNGLDLPYWAGGYGTTDDAAAIDGDADFDGDVDSGDFLIWQRRIEPGRPASPVGTPVPEPQLAALLFATFALRRRGLRPVNV
jgi:hypothetical protein